MVPARNLRRRHYDSYGAFFDDTHLLLSSSSPFLIPKPMAQHPSLPPRPTTTTQPQDQDEDDAATTSGGANSQAWLQLGIVPSPRPPPPPPSLSPSSPTELNLFPTASSPAASRPPPPPPQWGGLRFISPNPAASSSSAPPPEFLSAAAGRGGMRVVLPVARPQAGIWFVLQAAQNQRKEPFLPQIPKSYLRIKEGRMTVRLLIKYLVNKLGLEHESEVEVTCRGQRLLPFLQLQHVRDNIWRSTDAVSSSSSSTLDSPKADHVMTLQYSRSA